MSFEPRALIECEKCEILRDSIIVENMFVVWQRGTKEYGDGMNRGLRGWTRMEELARMIGISLGSPIG